ncbi:MAG: hypothetical protein HYU37_09565 [Acidobacteria bacterium]|nr:hypothetical protein [Acidobacteriota bacterium]
MVQDRFVDRTAYLEIVQQRIRARTESPGIVFLDPDTGLEPGTPGLEHVLGSELAAIWDVMPEGDLLVFYQHQTNRNNNPWVEPKKAQFERALNLPVGTARLARAQRIASDVAFFFAQKRGQRVPRRSVEQAPRNLKVTSALQEVLDCLNRTRTRATYGAVAEVIGGLARGVGQRLGARRPEASWIVSGASGLPSGYAPREMHPDLGGSPLVRTGAELRALLKRRTG